MPSTPPIQQRSLAHTRPTPLFPRSWCRRVAWVIVKRKHMLELYGRRLFLRTMAQGLGVANSSNHALQHDEDIDWRYYQRYSFRDKEDDATHYSANAQPNDKELHGRATV